MKWILFLFCFLNFQVQAEDFWGLVEKEDLNEIFEIFDDLENYKITPLYCREFLEGFNSYILLNTTKNISLKEAFQMSEKIINDLKISKNSKKLLKIALHQISRNDPKIILNLNENSNYLLCKKKKKNEKQDQEDVEIPGSIILGVTEIVGGALLWLTPFKKVGAGLIVDGVRRMFNDIQENDKKKEQQETFYESSLLVPEVQLYDIKSYLV